MCCLQNIAFVAVLWTINKAPLVSNAQLSMDILNNVTYLQDKANISVVHGYVNNHVEGTLETETSVSAITDGKQTSEVK